jgi:hypothetical protein
LLNVSSRREADDNDDESEEEEAVPDTNKGGRGIGSKTVERRLLAEFPSKKEAIKAGKKWLGGNCKASNGGNSWNYTGMCVSHSDCSRHFTVKATEPQSSLPRRTADYFGSWGVYVPVKNSIVEHSVSQILPWTGKGVENEFRARLTM